MQGIVVRYNAERGFGFLRGESSRGADTFFHKTAVVGSVVPPIDSVVEYIEEVGKDGRLRAIADPIGPDHASLLVLRMDALHKDIPDWPLLV